jgi:seryl-tRNA synthetase
MQTCTWFERLHQFDKVEIVRVEHPANLEALDGMVEHKKILNELEITLQECVFVVEIWFLQL